MPLFRSHRLLTLLAVSFFTLTGCSVTHALRVNDRTTVDIRTMTEDVSHVPVVFIGELHDSTMHHEVQLEVLKGLDARGISLAIGMEMFETPSQKELDAWNIGRYPFNSFVSLFQRNWRNISYHYYEDIFNFASDRRIPVIALNAPRDLVVKVSRTGLGSLTDVDLRQLPPGANAHVSDDFIAFFRESYNVHSTNIRQLRNICEAQMLRNRVMAHQIRTYNSLHPDRVIVVIAGGGHARGRGGVPPELGPLLHRVILPPVPGLSEKNIRRDDADYLLDEPFSLFNMLQ